jgi:regulator of protease activity HflC (stomatin/prohibitin superfamily)
MEVIMITEIVKSKNEKKHQFLKDTKRAFNPIGTTVSIILYLIEFLLFYLEVFIFDIQNRQTMVYAFLAVIASALIGSSMKTAKQWEKAVVLRFGKFHSLRGPGFFMVLPIIDRVDRYIDQRVRVDDFSAEQTLTKDTVPVNVDAVAYWTVWDAEKTALEVEKYTEAVSYAAQTGMRDIIGKHELSDLIQNREKIASELQRTLDEQTNPWGITCHTIGIKDIIIPAGLSDAMSKQAQAERERQARITLSTAETEIADKFAKASENYAHNPVALQLRGMNMLFEGLKEKGSLIIVPSAALESMNLGAIGGMTALAESQRQNVEVKE